MTFFKFDTDCCIFTLHGAVTIGLKEKGDLLQGITLLLLYLIMYRTLIQYSFSMNHLQQSLHLSPMIPCPLLEL